VDGDDDHRQDDGEGGEVVPFPGGRHPSQWPGDDVPESDESQPVRLPFAEGDQAAGEYEPLVEEDRETPASTYDLDAHRESDADDEGREREEESGDRLDEEAEPVYDKDDFDLAAGDTTLDDFTDDDYLRATTQEYQGLADAMAEAATEDIEMQAVAASMPGIDTGLVGFDDVTGEQPEMPVPEPRGRSNLSLRIVSGLAIVSLLIGTLVLGSFWLWLFVLIAVMIALGEFYATVRRRGFAPVALFGLIGGLGAFVAAYVVDGATPLAIAGAVGLTLVATTFWYAVVPRRNPLANASLTVFGMAWVAGLMAFAVPIILSPRYKELVLALALITGLFDIGSYFVGRAVGRTRMAKVLSPKKTLEGLVGGVVVALATGAGISYIDWFGMELRDGLLLGGIIAVAAPLGDLAESMIKRSLNTKDMGAILPGHGGLLDRIDSFIFTVPASYAVFLWLGFLA
jgi:CDP-diglyceride synthetase